MEFKKYVKIENEYREKFIEYFLDKFPELKDVKYVIQEKIHGANIQLIFSNGKMVITSRSQIVDDTFYGVEKVLVKYENYLNKMKKIGKSTSFSIFGELYGKGIQKGVDYGNDKYIRFFDIMFEGNEMIEPPVIFIKFMKDNGFEDIMVPIITFVNGLDDAIDFDVSFNSKINPVENNLCEGIVIKPLEKIYQTGKNIFFLKKKNEKFKEKQKTKVKRIKVEDPEETLARESFIVYINENRVNSVISKHGLLSSRKEINKYIKLVIEDAMEDYSKEVGEFPEKFKRMIGKWFGSTIAKILLNFVEIDG